jgi:hypothetical protein
MPTLTIHWVTMGDDNVCPICKELELTPWIFGPGHELGNELIRAPWGVVWDVAFGSTVHERGHHSTCRCHIVAEWDLEDVNTLLRALRDSLRNAISKGQTQGEIFTGEE